MNDRDDNALPFKVRWIADFIQRIGFPIVIALVLLYVLFVKMDHLDESFSNNSKLVADAVQKNTDATTALRHFLTHRYE